MNESQLDLKRLSEGQLIQLILDIYTEENMRANEGEHSRKKRVDKALAGSLEGKSDQALRDLRSAIKAEADERGISILNATQEDEEQLAPRSLDSMIAKAHRRVAEMYIPARRDDPQKSVTDTQAEDSRKAEVSKQEEKRTPVTDPEVAKRRALIKQNPGTEASELCVIFDRQEPPLALPAKWGDAGLKTWDRAYKDPNYRKRIDVIIAKDKRKN